MCTLALTPSGRLSPGTSCRRRCPHRSLNGFALKVGLRPRTAVSVPSIRLLSVYLRKAIRELLSDLLSASKLVPQDELSKIIGAEPSNLSPVKGGLFGHPLASEERLEAHQVVTPGIGEVQWLLLRTKNINNLTRFGQTRTDIKHSHLQSAFITRIHKHFSIVI